jgi:hypothetical protein
LDPSLQRWNDKDVAADVSLADASSADSSQAAVSPDEWFWSAFVSVERLPGVSFSGIESASTTSYCSLARFFSFVFAP